MSSASWFGDPRGRHQYRWHDGSAWTAWVHDHGVTTFDDTATEHVGGGFPWGEAQLRQVASWVYRRNARPSEPDDLQVLDYRASPKILGEWSSLARAVTKYAVGVSGIEGGSDLLGVLHAVTGSESAQDQLLQSIDAKVDALVKGPYNTGRTYLREAARKGALGKPQRPDIEHALASFFTAHGQAASVQGRALVEYHLGLTSLLLGHHDDAIHWLAEAHRSGYAVSTELARQAADIKVFQTSGSAASVAILYPPGLMVALGMKLKKLVHAEQRRDMLAGFLPFVACAARSHNCLVVREHRLPALELRRIDGGQYELMNVEAGTGLLER